MLEQADVCCLCSAGSFARVPGYQSGNTLESPAAAIKTPRSWMHAIVSKSMSPLSTLRVQGHSFASSGIVHSLQPSALTCTAACHVRPACILVKMATWRLYAVCKMQGRAVPSTGYSPLHQPGDATLPLELIQLNMESQQQRAFLQNVLQSHVHHPFGVHPLARVLAGLPAGAN